MKYFSGKEEVSKEVFESECIVCGLHCYKDGDIVSIEGKNVKPFQQILKLRNSGLVIGLEVHYK